MDEGFKRNYEVGITHGLKLVPTIILIAAKTAAETYKNLLAIEQGVEQ